MPAPDVQRLILQAARLYRAGRLRQAAVLYRRALNGDPTNAQVLRALGILADKMGRPDAALPLLRKAVAIAPRDVAARVDLGGLYATQGDLREAAEQYEEAIRLAPDQPAAYVRMGQVLMRLGQWQEAAELLEKAAELGRLTAESCGQAPAIEGVGEADLPDATEEAEPAAAEEVPASPDPSEAHVLAGRQDAGLLLGGFDEPPPEFRGLRGGPTDVPAVPVPVELTVVVVEAMGSWPANGNGHGNGHALRWEEAAVTSAEVGPDEPEPWEDPPDVAALHGVLPESVEGPSETDAATRTVAAHEDLVAWVDTPAPPAGFRTPPIDAIEAPVAMAGLIPDAPRGPPPVTEAHVVGSPPPVFPAAEGAAPSVTEEAPPALPGAAVDWAGPVEPIERAALIAEPTGPSFPADESQESSPRMPSADIVTMVTVGVEPPVRAEVVHSPIDSDGGVAVDPPEPADGSNTFSLSAEWDGEADDASPDADDPAFAALDRSSDEADAGTGEFEDDAEAPEGDAAPADGEEYNPRMLRRRKRKLVRSEASTLRARGVHALRRRKLDEAIACFSRLVQVQPQSAKAHRDLGAALLRDDRLEEAVAAFQAALGLRPKFAEAYASLGDAYHLLGKVDQAVTAYRQALSLKPSSARAHSNLLLTLNYHPKFDPQLVCEQHLLWYERHAKPLESEVSSHANDRTPGRPIRVGYVSPDFRRHSVNYFIEPALARHDHERFHVTCYSDAIRPDEVTERIAGLCDNWRDVRGMSDADLAHLVREDAIDILVDLSGHTGLNRMLAFARKPAPVQVTYLGYPNTTGLPTIDWRITDAVADPQGLTERYHTERFARLPHTFLCYAPPPEAPPTGEPPVLKNGYVTFGCFNILAKVTPDVMALWARILKAVPNSRLLMKDRGGTFGYATRRRYVQDVFRFHGVTADRLELCDKETDYSRHLEAYSRVDVVLDPFPYNGTTTTCEALWMGVPVVTLAGRCHAGRVGASILTNLDLRHLIALSPDLYVRIAADLARDPDNLLFIRDTLRERMSRSPLMDAAGFTRSLETLYRQMWDRWCGVARHGANDPGDTGTVMSLSDE